MAAPAGDRSYYTKMPFVGEKETIIKSNDSYGVTVFIARHFNCFVENGFDYMDGCKLNEEIGIKILT